MLRKQAGEENIRFLFISLSVGWRTVTMLSRCGQCSKQRTAVLSSLPSQIRVLDLVWLTPERVRAL